MQSIVLHKTIIANENVYVFFEWNESCVSNIIKKFHISNKMLRTIDIELTLNISCWILIPMLYLGNILNTPKHIKADKEITPNKFWFQ